MKLSVRRPLEGTSFYITVKVTADEVDATLPERVAEHLKNQDVAEKLRQALNPLTEIPVAE